MLSIVGCDLPMYSTRKTTRKSGGFAISCWISLTSTLMPNIHTYAPSSLVFLGMPVYDTSMIQCGEEACMKVLSGYWGSFRASPGTLRKADLPRKVPVSFPLLGLSVIVRKQEESSSLFLSPALQLMPFVTDLIII